MQVETFGGNGCYSIDSGPTLWDLMGCNLPGSSVHGILQVVINTAVGSRSLLQGVFLTQGLNLSLFHCRQILYLQQGSLTGIYLSPNLIYIYIKYLQFYMSIIKGKNKTKQNKKTEKIQEERVVSHILNVLSSL